MSAIFCFIFISYILQNIPPDLGRAGKAEAGEGEAEEDGPGLHAAA